MPSSGTGSDVSPEDVRDLLQKFITESTRVQALCRCTNSITAGVLGVLGEGPEGTLMVKSGNAAGDPFLIFDPRLATSFKYGDRRALPQSSLSGPLSFDSSLILLYPDHSHIALFEVETR